MKIIETILISGISCILPLIGMRLIFDFTRILLFNKD